MRLPALSTHTTSITCGLAAALGMLVPGAWPLTLIGLSGWFYILWYRTASVRHAAYAGLWFGILTSAAGLISLLEIFPPEGALTPLSTGASVLFLFLAPTLALGATSVPIAVVVYFLRENAFAPLAAVVAWLLNEELKMWAWLLLTYGPGAAFEPHLSIAALGYALADSSWLLQLAEGGGLLFLTASLALFAAALTRTVRFFLHGSSPSSTGTLAVLSIVLLLSPFFQSPPESIAASSIRIAAFSSTVGIDGVREDRELIETLSDGPLPQVFIFPEGKHWNDIAHDGVFLKDRAIQGRQGLLVIRSEETSRDGVRHNTVRYESETGEVYAEQDKRFLMPQGEYHPWLSRLFFALVPRSAIQSISPEQSASYGKTLTGMPYKGTVFGTLLCSEIFSPSLYEKLADAHEARVLVNLADPVWFRGSRLLYRKTVQVAKVHAVAHRVYFIEAQNAAPSFIVTPNGTVLQETAWNRNGVLLFDLPVSANLSATGER